MVPQEGNRPPHSIQVPDEAPEVPASVPSLMGLPAVQPSSPPGPTVPQDL